MAIARFPSIVIDCPNPPELAGFYAKLLDWGAEIDADWADVRADNGQALSFQRVEDYSPPQWPGREAPQQMHLDVIVDDLDSAEEAVLRLGATRLPHSPADRYPSRRP